MRSPIRRFPFASIQVPVLVLALATGACTAGTAPATTTAPAIKFETVNMTIKGKPYTIEIADNDEKEARGLMFRTSMPKDHGMLFIFDKPDIISFWMKDTLIPLDIIYLDANAKVLEIHQRKPLDEEGRASAAPALYVVELNAGVSAAIGLKPGDTLALPEKYLKKTPSTTDK